MQILRIGITFLFPFALTHCLIPAESEHYPRTQLSPQEPLENQKNINALSGARTKQMAQPQLTFPNDSDSTPGVNAYDKVEGNVWRTAMDPRLVYQMTTRALSRSYIINSADKRNLSISTDWDKFFVEGRLFRNRMNVTVFSIGTRQTEIIIKNTVEYYSGSPQNPIDVTASQWLPSPDITDEVPRFIDSLNQQTALLLSRHSPSSAAARQIPATPR